MAHFFTAKLEKHIAYEIVNNEINVENNVTKKMALILENNIATIQKQKRVVTKLMQDTESARHKHQVNRLIISDTVVRRLYRYNLYIFVWILTSTTPYYSLFSSLRFFSYKLVV